MNTKDFLMVLPRISISLILCALLFAPIASLKAEEWAFIDLKPYANSKIVDTEWWTGNAGASDLEELLEIAKDGHEFEGPGGEPVQFKVEDANLRIFGTNAAANPKEIEGSQPPLLIHRIRRGLQRLSVSPRLDQLPSLFLGEGEVTRCITPWDVLPV